MQWRTALPVERPSVVVLAGPNGAGKSTLAGQLLVDVLGVSQFVDADLLARSLALSETAPLTAGRAMLRRLDELTRARQSFGFETTLASRSFAPRIRRLRRSGYECHLVFLWLPAADLAVARVADRVRLGGHDVPEETIRRRYRSGLRNFFHLYQALTTTWRMYDNSTHQPRLIASGAGRETLTVNELHLWQRIRAEAGHAG
ncbi:MAG TPA: zeta toxin family protein [Candidatus Acidoferrum sp.]|nr:zeta toxin family protein [Candidatus Acidoferrum sp.]